MLQMNYAKFCEGQAFGKAFGKVFKHVVCTKANSFSNLKNDFLINPSNTVNGRMNK